MRREPSFTADGALSLFLEYEGEPNGLKIHKDGRLFVTDYRNGIITIDPKTRKIEPHVTQVANERLHGPNDLSFASNGDLYFTDQGNSVNGCRNPTKSGDAFFSGPKNASAVRQKPRPVAESRAGCGFMQPGEANP